MKEELKVLRQWIDRYNLQDMREQATNFLKTSKKISFVTFSGKDESLKEVRSVNEQLHQEKEILHGIIFKMLINNLQQNP